MRKALALLALLLATAHTPAAAQDADSISTCTSDCVQRLLALTRETSRRLDLLQARVDIMFPRASTIVTLYAVSPAVIDGKPVFVAQGWGFTCNGGGPLSQQFDFSRVAIVVDDVETGDSLERVARPDVVLWSEAIRYCGFFGGGVTPLNSGFNIVIPVDGVVVAAGRRHTFKVRLYDPFGRATESISITR